MFSHYEHRPHCPHCYQCYIYIYYGLLDTLYPSLPFLLALHHTVSSFNSSYGLHGQTRILYLFYTLRFQGILLFINLVSDLGYRYNKARVYSGKSKGKEREQAASKLPGIEHGLSAFLETA